jgi:integrase
MASIEKTEQGTYRVRWRNPQGRTRSKSFKIKQEAANHLRAIRSDLHTGHYTDPQAGKTRFGDWINEWHHSRIGIRPTTKARDDSYITNLIQPHLATHQLRLITPATIRTWISTIDQTHKPATVHKAHQLVKAALRQAVTDGLIPANPCATTPLPRIEKTEHRYLTINEVHHLATTISPRYRALVYTGALAGLRPGELAALHIDDIDFLRKTLRVERTASEVAGHLDYGPPKTKAGRRTIAIPDVLADVLAEHLANYPSDTPFVFTTATGKPIRWTNLRRRQWRQAVKGSVGTPCVPHDLRHTHAALAINEGVHAKVLQARMGHSSITVTMDTYGGLFAGFDEGVATAFDDAFAASFVSDSCQNPAGDVVALPTK